MNTKTMLDQFYETLKNKGDWMSFFSDTMTFINNGRETAGKEQAMIGSGRFYSMVSSFGIKEMVIGDEKASTVVRYQLHGPQGASFTSDVAEFFSIKDGKFQIFSIYFDTAPYPPR